MSAIAIVISYILGSIPTGLWLGLKFRGIDIREHGSKNIGATNTMRVLGKTLGAIALAADMAKGAIPVLLIARLGNGPNLALVCGLAAILGHTFSLFLRFKGGKGVATATGVFLALCPIPTLIAAGVFAAVVGATRMVSAGSVSAAAALTVTVYVFPATTVLRLLVTAVAALVIWKHRANIQRIRKGQENRI